MTIKGFALTLGLGMVGGAVAATVLPKQPQVRSAVSMAADTLENAVESAKTAICGECSQSSQSGQWGQSEQNG